MMENLLTYHRRHFNYPTYMEIMAEAERLRAGVTRVLTKEQVIYMLDKRVIEATIKHELLLAFQVFDTEKRNFLELGEFLSIVTDYGDGFNKDESIEISRDANIRGDGNIFYENFVENLFAMAPELYEITTDFLYTDPDEDPSVPPLPPEPEPEPVVETPPPPPPPPPPPAKGKAAAKGKKK
ncbi:uncharacterized protein LOC134672436 isoform X2 [Cydia fagiglandana]|uniref:uncharacterized protein LOC134672436 isoform X2 n=1 Tax=Cydia fagiglandana TaxID=1458189 RepID=UPI002FEE07EE